MLGASGIDPNGDQHVAARHDHAVDVDRQQVDVVEAALLQRRQLRRTGFDEAARHAALGNAYAGGDLRQDLVIPARRHAGNHDVAHPPAETGIVLQAPIGWNLDFAAAVLAAQPRPAHTQLALGQHDAPALHAVPTNRSAGAALVLDPGHLLRRQLRISAHRRRRFGLIVDGISR
jgi:hypothetical protein